MKLQNLVIIFLIIIIPLILVSSYYIGLQIDTINMQTSYNIKLTDATREAIDALEINTVEWNSKYSAVSDSKRRDIQASINTFITSLSNNLGISGSSKTSLLSYIPAVAYTLYDGYYIYSPTEVAKVYTTINDNIDTGANLVGGNVQYVKEDESLTTERGDEDVIKTYTHVLKPFTAYSCKLSNYAIINFTLDNYITVYGKDSSGNYFKKSGYLCNTDNITINDGNIQYKDEEVHSEVLSERVVYKDSDNNRTSM